MCPFFMEQFFFVFVYLLESRTLDISFVKEHELFYSLYLVLSPLCSLFLFLLVIFKYSVNKRNGIIIGIIIYSFLIVLSNFLAAGNFRVCMGLIYPILGLSSLLIIVSRNEKRFKCFVRLLSILYLLLIFIHFIESVISPNVEGYVYMLGNENHVGFTLFVGLSYQGANLFINKSKHLFSCYLALYVMSSFLVFSVTSLLGVLLFLIAFYFPYFNRFIQRKTILFILNVFILLGVIFLTFGLTVLESENVSSLLFNYLGKNSTLTNRTLIWPQVIMDIFHSPIFGYGFSSDDDIFMVVTPNGSVKWLSAHNQFLQTLYNSGLIGIFALLFFLKKIGDVMNPRSNDLYSVTKTKTFYKCIMIGMLFSLFGEAVQFTYLIESMLIGSLCCVSINTSNHSFLHEKLIKYNEKKETKVM